MKKLLVHLAEYKKESILGPLFKLLEATLELLVPLVVAAIIDVGIKSADRGYIVRMSLLLVLLGVVGLAFSITAQYFAAKASAGFVKKLKHELFRHIQSLSYAELDRLGTSTMITRMTSDMNQVQSGVNLTLRLLLRSPFVVFGAMVMAFLVDFKAALVFVAAIPVLSVIVFGIMLWTIPLYKRAQARLDRVLALTRENLTGVRVIRAFRKEAGETAEFTARNGELTRVQKHVGRISALMNPLTYVVINLAVAYLVWVGALRVEAGILTQGAVVALYSYMSQILVELVKLASLIITITKAIACGNRIQAALEIAPSQAAPELPPTQSGDLAVEFENAGLLYPNAGGSAISGINLKVKRGEIVGVIGGTGAGKTTLVNLIPRFYDATHGRVLVNGADVRDYPMDLLRGKIGVVPQKAALFKGTIRENLLWGKPDATDAELLAALKTAQAEDVAEAKGGLGGFIEQRGRNLSGGQAQRLTIARALVRKPEILILDDSASALDFATDAALRKAVREIEPRPAVFVVSQRASSVRFADRIVVLDDGNVAGVGTSDELYETCAVYREIFDSQYRKEGAHEGE